MSTPNLQGLIPILATPFSEDGTLDESSLRRLVRFELECRVDGLGLFGFASEAFALTASERDVILHIVGEEASGTVPLIVGASGHGTLPAIEEALRAVEGGADALMVLPPFMAKPDGPRLIEFYGELADAVEVPVMVQDAPATTGVSMAPDLLGKLGSLANVDYVKIEAQPTAVKIGQTVEVTDGHMGIFGGQNALFFFEEMDRGAVGTMPACEFADGLRVVLDAREAGHRDEARELYHQLLPLIRYGLQPGLAWAIHKEVLRMGDVIESGKVRAPALPMDKSTKEGLLEALSGLDLLVLRKGF